MDQAKTTSVRLGPLQKMEILRLAAQDIVTTQSQARGTADFEVTAGMMIDALAGRIMTPVRITLPMVEHLRSEKAHQDLINASVLYALRTAGPNTPYREAYPDYLDHARARGIQPVSLKTFKNRALAVYGLAAKDSIPANVTPLIPLRDRGLQAPLTFDLESAL